MAKKKSKYVSALDEVQKSFKDILKSKGFKKKGRSYNRECADQITHVINFQMGEYPIGNYVIPGLRDNLYGSFAVNLGVHLPCVSEVEGNSQKLFYQDHDCQIRHRLGKSVNDESDRWWSLEKTLSKTIDEVKTYIETTDKDFFNYFTSYESVVEYFDTNGFLPFSNKHRSALEVAIVCHKLGKTSKSQMYFKIASGAEHKGFVGYVKNLQDQLQSAPN